MKRLFQLAVIVGVACVVYAVFTRLRRGTPAEMPWIPPTVDQTPPAPPAPVEGDVAAAEEEGMTRPADAPAEDLPLASDGSVLRSEFAAPAAESTAEREAVLEAEAAHEAALEVATDEGMPLPPGAEPEDAALGSRGEALVSELAAPGMAAALIEDIEAEIELALDAAADEGMTLPFTAPPPGIGIDSEGAILVSELAAADFEGDVLDAESAFLERIAGSLDDDDAPTAAEAEAEAAPDFAATVDEAEPMGFEVIAPDLEFVGEQSTTAATSTAEPPAPLAEPAAPAGRRETEDQLLASVEQALDDLEPASIVPPPRRSAESYLDEGNVYFNVGQYGLAIERYGQAIELDDELTAAFYNRANAHTRAGEFELALSDYNRALELQPLDADALNNRGMLHLYRANYAAALGDFNRALEIDPSDTTVMVNRGLAHLHGGNAAAALVDFREASTMDAGDAAAQYGAAQAAASMGNREEALRHIGRALELDPGYAREAAGDPRLAMLAGDEEFLKLLRQSGTRSG